MKKNKKNKETIPMINEEEQDNLIALLHQTTIRKNQRLLPLITVTNSEHVTVAQFENFMKKNDIRFTLDRIAMTTNKQTTRRMMYVIIGDKFTQVIKNVKIEKPVEPIIESVESVEPINPIINIEQEYEVVDPIDEPVENIEPIEHIITTMI